MLLIKKSLPDPAKHPNGDPVIKVFRVLVSEIQGPRTILMDVPREEFYAAALHYKGRAAVETLLLLESKAIGRADTLHLDIKKVCDLGQYLQAMFKGGRWTDEGLGHVPRDVTIQ